MSRRQPSPERGEFQWSWQSMEHMYSVLTSQLKRETCCPTNVVVDCQRNEPKYQLVLSTGDVIEPYFIGTELRPEGGKSYPDLHA